MNFQNRKTIPAGVRLGLLLVTILACHAAAAAQPRKLIIDCDPGIDDAVALILAMQHPGFEILGVTTTFGNATLEQATKNALRVVELSGRAIPVYRALLQELPLSYNPPSSSTIILRDHTLEKR
jgi:hypothetical protein